ncbi:MAG: acyl-CoA dehydratase activase [Spirochaetes bacterium]|jgi:predicted CoA-substrate-specific enzyme activase|nr:acyl-CoA dehydratase activase [Spirochaetota bacterium]
MITAGIDIGSITAKALALSGNEILGSRVAFTGYNPEQAAADIFGALLAEIGIERASIGAVVSTGYGRNAVRFADRAITEIICHAAGAYFQDPSVRTVIDIGGQDSKIISIADGGRVRDFAMNDKCAAGTGRFLEVMSRAMEVPLDSFGEMSRRSKSPAPISNTCTVFAESEVISLISKGVQRQDILAGLHESIASRIASMAARIGVAAPVMMTGGVAKNGGLVDALERCLSVEISVTPNAQVNGALGAAVLAAGGLEKK